MKATVLALGALAVLTTTTSAQRGPAQSVPAPRALGPVVGRSTQTFSNISRLITVNGTVFVNDGGSRQLWLLDTALTSGRIVLDSTSGTGKESWYGPEFGNGAQRLMPGLSGALHRFRGDSVMFAPEMIFPGGNGAGPSGDLLIIGPSGKTARIAAAPTSRDIGCAIGDADNTGWHTCQNALPLTWLPSVDMGDSVMTIGKADSSVIVAVNFKTWDVDTIARFTTSPRTQLGFSYRGRTDSRSAVIFPVIFNSDAWAVFRDGTLAIVRGVDYHVDIMDVRRQVIHGPRAPFDWRRLTDDDKDRILDSLRIVDSTARHRADSLRKVQATRAVGANDPGIPPRLLSEQLTQRTPPDEWPSYWPPMKPGNGQGMGVAVTDEDDRLWVAERQPPGSDSISVYGIFDKKGQFLERVKIPSNQTLIGFAAGGVVYLTTVDGGRTILLKAHFK